MTVEDSNDWAITTERYVGYIDIMGFKELVYSNEHDDIYQIMRKINESVEGNISLNSKDGRDNVRVTNYSDSIIVYSKNNSLDSCDSFIYAMAGLSSDLFLAKIPHRGAFAFGKMTLDVDNSIFFGQPLIDAYLLEAELNFYGIVGHASVEKEISELKKRGNFDNPFYIEYNVPFKTNISNHFTIPPVYAGKYNASNYKDENQAKAINDRYIQLEKKVYDLRYMTSGHLRKYIDNTLNYHVWLKNNWI